jgi:hypothetical protein
MPALPSREEHGVFRPVAVKPLHGFKLWLRYADGAEGEVDLSDLAGRGVFELWNQPGAFERVHISAHGSVAWTDEIEVCPDALYLELTGRKPEDLFPGLKSASDA